MPQLRPNDVEISDEEDAAINAAIASDPDTRELDDEWFATSKRIWEIFPMDVCEEFLNLQRRHLGGRTEAENRAFLTQKFEEVARRRSAEAQVGAAEISDDLAVVNHK